MSYLKRFALSAGSAFVVLGCVSLALALPSRMNSDTLRVLIYGALPVCMISGSISAALIRKNPVAMVLAAQLLAIAIVGVARNL